MGGAVSSGQDNDELIDNLKDAGYIKTAEVERVFRLVDRAHYYLAEFRENAYKDLAWKNGTLHLSAPCIYSEVMEALELKKGLSFLNLGSGTGYLSTMVGLIIGPYGVNHGIELHASNVTFANRKLENFILAGKKFDDLELCEPQFVVGNCLNLAPENRLYDRVYCGSGCPLEQRETFQNMIKVNGILVAPVGDQLLKIKRISETEFVSENVLPVSFASLVLPVPSENNGNPIVLPDVNPLSLQCICRVVIRDAIRSTFDFELPEASEASDEGKVQQRAKTTKCFRSESARNPLNILPTAQGLMLLAAFDSSDEGEDDGSENSRGSGIHSILDLNRHLRRHVTELRSRERSSKNATNDVDSDLSDMDDEGIQTSDTKDVNGNKNSSILSGTSNHRDHEDGDMDGIEESQLESLPIKESSGSGLKLVERNGSYKRSTVERANEESGLAGGTRDHTFSNPYENIAERILTIMSPSRRDETSIPSERDSDAKVTEAAACQKDHNDVLTSEYNARSPAIEVTPSAGVSVPRTIKESYSTSADTSETSGFGSLVDDALHMNSQQSGLGSFKDDMEMTGDDFLPVSSSPASTNKRSPRYKSSFGESSVDYDSLTADSGDATWIDTEDEDDEHLGESKVKKIRNIDDEKISTKKEISKVDKKPADSLIFSPRGPDFSAFLRAKIEDLPIPSTLKAFLLYYRKAPKKQ